MLVNHTSNNPKDYGSDYVTEDHGTANIVVIAPNGDAIAATSTINLMWLFLFNIMLQKSLVLKNKLLFLIWIIVLIDCLKYY